MSWGSGEFSAETSYDGAFTTPGGHPGVTFVASSGDDGGTVPWPAASPNVLAVGGTMLSRPRGNYARETAWSGSGGGVSRTSRSPPTRAVFSLTVAADPGRGLQRRSRTPGFPSTTRTGMGGWLVVGGTSAGAPQWAALVAMADQVRGHGSTLDSSQTLPVTLYTPRLPQATSTTSPAEQQA